MNIYHYTPGRASLQQAITVMKEDISRGKMADIHHRAHAARAAMRYDIMLMLMLFFAEADATRPPRPPIMPFFDTTLKKHFT